MWCPSVLPAPCSVLPPRVCHPHPYFFTRVVALWGKRSGAPPGNALSLSFLWLWPHPAPDECFLSWRATHKDQQTRTTRTSPREKGPRGKILPWSLHCELSRWSRKTSQWGTQRKMVFWECGKIPRCGLSTFKDIPWCSYCKYNDSFLDPEGLWSKQSRFPVTKRTQVTHVQASSMYLASSCGRASSAGREEGLRMELGSKRCGFRCSTY